MSSEAAATYLPDYQVIKFKSLFQPFADPENLRGFETPQEVAFFIHEWIHFLHNISTYHGITAYSHTILLWSNVRTYIHDTLPASNIEHLTDIHKQLLHRLNARTPKINNIPQNVSSSDIKLLSYSLKSWFIDNDDRYKCTEIICNAEISNAQESTSTILIGSHEIVESVAFLLEERYLIKKRELTSASPIPYHLVNKLASLTAPDLNKEVVLKCALLALQHIDPPEWLPDLLKTAQKAYEEDLDPDQIITKKAIDHLKLHEGAIANNIDFLDSLFSSDEPVARAVKYATGKMRINLNQRLVDPFFEISLIDNFASQGKAAIFMSLEKHGTGFLIQERSGDAEKILKDLTYNISIADKVDTKLSYGRRVALASFLYTFSFLKTNSKDIEHPEKLICPFYTCCSNKLRRESAITCKTRPWISQYLALENMCYFGRAVLNNTGRARVESDQL
ncbi:MULTISPECIES: hypothetical protein [unclassified Pseudomonas]|uniref:hypothetical protein n=1 Tax=unclassified Pseudomonas TaxID=196821 RepID=UPI001F56992F|nr:MULTISPECIES: hypothetical protein [unclassified Pseudomonas]